MSPIAIRLREVREAAGLTQEQLSQRAGVRQAAISEIEAGKRQRIDLDLLEKLCRALKVEPGDIVTMSRRR